jgi:hypothetical protein
LALWLEYNIQDAPGRWRPVRLRSWPPLERRILGIPLLVIHERIGFWARQLRARLSERALRVVETRSGDDLEAVLGASGVAVPVVLVDVGWRARAVVDEMLRGLAAAPEALVLVLDPLDHEGVALLAREAGAAHVISGPVTPPAVAGLLARWLALSQRRGELQGWAGASPAAAQPEPWNWLTPMLERKPTP